jgi:hypothetical protein
METIDITPDWSGMRRFVIHVARTDLDAAQKIAAELRGEAPVIAYADDGSFAGGFATPGQAADHVREHGGRWTWGKRNGGY